MRKPKVMMVNESSELTTGYSTYGLEVLSRLQKMNKYEICELACYSHPDQQHTSRAWQIIHGSPDTRNESAVAQFNANTLHQFGSWNFEQACLEFQPDIIFDIRDYWMCLKSCDIKTYDGFKDIKDIKTGDIVLTHTGQYKKVVQTFQRKYSGNIHKINASNFNLPIEITDGHPILTIKRSGKLLPDFKSESPDWVNSENVKFGDIVCVPINRDVIESEISEKLARLLGYYTAEGCVMYEGRKIHNKLKGVQFVFHANEVAYAKEVVDIIEDLFGLKAKVKIKNNCTIIRVFSESFTQTILSYVSGLSVTKKLSNKITQAPQGIAKSFLCGYFRGDGHNINRTGFCTSSKQLAIQIFDMCLRFKMLPSFGFNKNKIQDKVFYRYIFTVAAKSKLIYKAINEDRDLPDVCSKRVDEKYAYLTVKKVITTYEENVDVYNFEVEDDNSYTSSFCLHNCEFQNRSPFRPFYDWAIMPTVDSSPQDEQWISTYSDANGVFTYTDWGYEILKQEGGGLINLKGTASPGVNYETEFKPALNKKQHRASFGFEEDLFIVGTVCRNQARKLIPDLCESFRKFLDKAPKSIGDKTFLYLHTGYPDIGWDIPRLLKMNGLSHKVLFTYVCRNCGTMEPKFYSDIRTVCGRCGQPASTLPSTRIALSRESLAAVFNFMDAYVQLSIAGGFEMPIAEAAACGIPVFATDYSAMSDVVRKVKGTPLKLSQIFCEAATGCYRVYTDHNDLVDKLIKFFSLPGDIRFKRGRDARSAIESGVYNWDKTTEAWANYFDSVTLKDPSQTWKSPPRYFNPQPLHAQHTQWNHKQFVEWAFTHVLGQPDKINSYLFNRVLRDLNAGCHTQGMGGLVFNEASTIGNKPNFEEYTRAKVVDQLTLAANLQNHWENQRIAAIQKGLIK